MPAPDPDCPHCEGFGSIETETIPPHPPSFRRCECVLRLDLLQNVERALKGLSEVPPIKSSPLVEREEGNLWITAGDDFLSHLRHVGVRKPLTWYLKVISDAELTTSWLASIALQGKDILDADAYKVSTKHLTIPDLVVPPDLLVIRMGIKVARNSAAAECLGEALNTRYHEGKPTWLWDQPHHPLNTGHLFWSDLVARIIGKWDHLTLRPESTETSSPSPGSTTRKKRAGRKKPAKKTLRGGG